MYRKFGFVTLDSGYLTSLCNDSAKHTGILFIDIQILVLAELIGRQETATLHNFI